MRQRMATKNKTWAERRAGFIARHMGQVEANGEPLWDEDGDPTDRHLGLVAWAYSPTPAKLRSWAGKQGSAARLSGFQRKLLKIAKRYKRDPEVAIRTQDALITAALGLRSSCGGVSMSADELTSIGREAAAGLFPPRGAGVQQSGMANYLAIANDQIIANRHYCAKGQINQDFPEITRVANWFAKQVQELVQKARRGELRETAADTRYRSIKAPQQAALSRNLLRYTRQLPEIVDWVMAEDPFTAVLPTLTWNQARLRASRWHKALQQGAAIEQMRPGEIVWTAPDESGWTVHELDADQLTEEGAFLNHCVGGAFYKAGVVRGDKRIYSLRDPNGAPRITFELVMDARGEPSRFRQAKGHRNRKIGAKKATMLEECLYTRAWLESMLVGSDKSLDISGTDWTAQSFQRWVGQRVTRRIESLLGPDFTHCTQILFRETGWDRLDKVPLGQVPTPMPTRGEYLAFRRRNKKDGSSNAAPVRVYLVGGRSRMRQGLVSKFQRLGLQVVGVEGQSKTGDVREADAIVVLVNASNVKSRKRYQRIASDMGVPLVLTTTNMSHITAALRRTGVIE
jgi:hypothetical protein